MSKLVIYIHGKGGTAEESEHYIPLFKGYDVVGFDYKALTPWEAREEFPAFVDPLYGKYESIILVASSIGAYYAMHALADRQFEKAFLISPVVDMEKLISDMMTWAGVAEDELRKKKEIPTAFGETLSWEYWSYAKAHPITWQVPTYVLYGEKDTLISFGSVSAFVEQTGAALTVMKNGEHWFHTDEQMDFLDLWIKQSL